MKALLIFAVAIPLMAQSYPKHNFTFGAGAGLPRADLTPFFADRPGIGVGYGYRFHRFFQADAGLDVVFGAAQVRDFLPTQFGSLRIQDYQYLVPLGGRVVLPVAGGRLLFSAGGGGTYMRYSERLRQPSDYYRFECPVCNSRSGWGYYGLVGTRVALDYYKRFWFGVTSKVYRGHTEGDPLGEVPGLRTRDQWINVFAEFGVSF